jgi:hypothetical protein
MVPCSRWWWFILSAALLASHICSGAILGGPVTNFSNGHVYYLLSVSDWPRADREARTMGGALATVNDAAEQTWIYNSFNAWGGVPRHLWIGLYDANQHADSPDLLTRRGEFLWIEGEPANYRNWSSVEPSDSGGNEQVVHIWSPNNANAGRWNDASAGTTNLFGDPLHGVVEVDPNRGGRPEDMVNATAAPDVNYPQGTTRKISQLIGDYDRHRQTATENQTQTRYGLALTDLGVPFNHNGRTYIAFGDVPGGDRDPLAYTTDMTPEDGLALSFVADGTAYRPITIPGITQRAFEVPLDGMSLSNRMYLYHSTDHSAAMTMGRSVLAVSDDDGRTFRLLYTLSRRHFINVSVVQVPLQPWPGFPVSTGDGVVIFGSGRYRASNVRLAFQPALAIENPAAIRYFAGLDAYGTPTWSSNELDAISLFDQPCVGEFSVTYNPFLRKWLMLYNCGTPRGINYRTADQPWGPWSDSQVLFEPWDDGGYCAFMHTSWTFQNCDSVHDPGRENEWAGEYGPYVFEDLTTGTNGRTTIYFTMSTWNPYTVVLMKSELVLSNTPPASRLVWPGATWKYLDNGSNQGTAWRSTNFNDSAWRSGPAQLGFGDADERTVINGGPAGAHHMTTYFRRSWLAPDTRIYSNLVLRVLRDDGCVVYLNGAEIFRSNMPDTAISYTTPARASVGGADEDRFYSTNVPMHLLRRGTNTLAVEVHQYEPASSDVSFDLELAGALNRPVLEIERNDNLVKLAWPFPSTGYRLELSPTLSSGAWSQPAFTLTVTNGQKTLRLPASGPTRYFRLAQPPR